MGDLENVLVALYPFMASDIRLYWPGVFCTLCILGIIIMLELTSKSQNGKKIMI